MTNTRVTAGEWRSRLISTPPGRATRPTSSKVREALFNILGTAVVDARILDLFAGAGTLSFEALSRGAASATLVERDRACVKLIAETALRLGCAGDCEVVQLDVLHWLGDHTSAEYDIAFCDPPYQDDVIIRALTALGTRPPALLVCEHHRGRVLADRFGSLRRTREAHYGQTTLSLYTREETGR